MASKSELLLSAGLKAGEGEWADIKPGEGPSGIPQPLRPLANIFGIYDERHDNRILELAEAQSLFTKGWGQGLLTLGKEAALGKSQPTLGQFSGSQGGLPAGFLEQQQVLQSPNMTPLPTNRAEQLAYQEGPVTPPISARYAQEIGAINPQARLSPSQMTVAAPLLEQRAVLGRGGEIVPTALVPNERKREIREVGGQLYEITPQGVQQLTNIPPQPRQLVNPVDQRVAVLSKGKFLTLSDALAGGAQTIAEQAEKDVRETRPVTVAGATGVQAQQIAQGAPLPQGERKNLFDRKTFLSTGELKRLVPGVSKGAAARADVIEIGDKELENLAALQGSIASVRGMFDLSDEIITADNPVDAALQGIRLSAEALAKSNPAAVTYKSTKDAFTTTTARQVGQERGVLTDQDVARWSRTLPDFGDTVQVKEKKRKIFNRILNATIEANRRILAGDSPDKVKKEVHNMLDPLLRQAEAMPLSKTYVEIRTTKDGRKLGKLQDGAIEEIK